MTNPHSDGQRPGSVKPAPQSGDLNEIVARCEAASAAPWRWTNEGLTHSGAMQYLVLNLPHPYLSQSRAADLELIEHAPSDLRCLLELVADLRERVRYAETRLSDAANLTHKAQAAAGQLGQDLQHMVHTQPLLDRAAKLEAALEVVAAREVLNSAARGRVDALIELAHTAWTIIAAAENFKHELVDGVSRPIGPQDWRNAATEWRDRFHVLTGVLPLQHAPAAAVDPHAVCASEVVKVRGDFNRLADELERVRDVHRQQRANHDAERARWQPQIDGLTTERDAASRERREAEVRAHEAQQALASVEREMSEMREAAMTAHQKYRAQINAAHTRIEELEDQVNALAASEAVRVVTAHALLRETADVLRLPAGQEVGHAVRRDLLSRIGIALGEQVVTSMFTATADGTRCAPGCEEGHTYEQGCLLYRAVASTGEQAAPPIDRPELGL